MDLFPNNINYWLEQFRLSKQYVIDCIDDYLGKNPGMTSSLGIIYKYVGNLELILQNFSNKELYKQLYDVDLDLELYCYDESEGKITPEYQKSINEELLELQEFLRHMELEE